MTLNHEGHEDLSTTKATKVTKKIGLFMFGVLAGAVVVAAAGTPWIPTQSRVRVTCPLTIGGSFEAKTTALSGSLTTSASHPPSYDGGLVVDLRTIDTGINLRNNHLREKYLEVDKAPGYDKATLSEIDLKGLSPDAPRGKGTFSGSFVLHGTRKTVGGPVEIREAGAGFLVKASFPVNLSDYNIPEPRYLGVGVKNTVQVEVTFLAAPEQASQLRSPRLAGQATATR